MKKITLSLLLTFGLYASTNHQAVITETMSSGGYTYMKVQEKNKSYWIAMTQRNVKKGDTIKYAEQGWMQNFHSKTLNRTFEKILFAADATPQNVQQVKRKPDILTSKYAKEGTITIAELAKNREKYVGKKITIRGKVTKTSQAIMKRNWIHIEDGSRFANFDDLVFTSQTLPKVGDIVYATGKVIKDKDFGYGYFYPIIIEDASFKK